MTNPLHGIRMSDNTYMALQRQLMLYRETNCNSRLTMGDMLTEQLKAKEYDSKKTIKGEQNEN